MSEQGDLLIINGTRINNMPISYLYTEDGDKVPVWSINPSDLADAYGKAVGQAPQPPEFGLAGVFAQTSSTQAIAEGGFGIMTQEVYDPSQDNLNTLAMQTYQNQLAAWQAHAGFILEAIKMLGAKS